MHSMASLMLLKYIPQASGVLSFCFCPPCLSVSAGSSQALALRWGHWVWTSHGFCWWWWALWCGQTGSGGTSHKAWPAGPSWACWKTWKSRRSEYQLLSIALLSSHFVCQKKQKWVNYDKNAIFGWTLPLGNKHLICERSFWLYFVDSKPRETCDSAVGSLQMSKVNDTSFAICEAFRICILLYFAAGVSNACQRFFHLFFKCSWQQRYSMNIKGKFRRICARLSSL